MQKQFFLTKNFSKICWPPPTTTTNNCCSWIVGVS